MSCAGKVMTAKRSLYPLDDDGAPIANYVQIPVGGHPCFAAEPPGARLPAEADAVVMGGGYTGVSAALHLGLLRRAAGSDAPRLLLLEAGRVGCGPFGKSGGHVCGLQVADDAVLRHCGRGLGGRVIAAARGAAALVRSLAVGHGIPCDLRDGYVEIGRDGAQSLVKDGSLFGIDPYPYVLGLAHAARALGVGIREGVHVVDIGESRDGCRLTTPAGTIGARFVPAAGGPTGWPTTFRSWPRCAAARPRCAWETSSPRRLGSQCIRAAAARSTTTATTRQASIRARMSSLSNGGCAPSAGLHPSSHIPTSTMAGSSAASRTRDRVI